MQLRKLAFLFVGLIFFSCGSTISVFNETAYQQATTLKVECLALMDMATEPGTVIEYTLPHFGSHNPRADCVYVDIVFGQFFSEGLGESKDGEFRSTVVGKSRLGVLAGP